MFRLLISTFVFSILLSMPAFGAQPVSVKVIPKGDETLFQIEGDFTSYKALGRYSPARLVMELNGASLLPGTKRELQIKSPFASKVQLIPFQGGVSVVVFSKDPKELFRYYVEENEGVIWVSLRGKAPSVLPKNQPPSLYTGQKITMDFFKTDIHNVMRLFGEITGKNIVLDERVKGEVTISLKDVPWDQALEMILDANNLIKEEKNGVITIRPLPTEPAGQGVLISTPIPKERLGAVREWSREKAKEAQMFSLFYRAKVLEAEGDLRESFKTYEEVFRLMRSNESLMRANGWILEFLCEGAFKLGSLEKAYYYAKEALRVRGEEQWAAHVAAISAAMIGKETEAKIYFDMAMSMGDTNPDLLLNYGLFLENTGNGEGALGIYRRYEELMGPDLDVGLRVARLYKEAGDKQRACQKYKELITYSSAEEKGLTATIYENIKGTCGEGVVK